MSPKNVVITGGSRGIGAAIARAAAKAGHQVLITYVREEAAAESVVDDIRSWGGSAETCRADMGSEGDISHLFEEVDARLGRLDALVNNAGVSSHTTAAEADTTEIRRLLEVNVLGVMLTSRAAIRRMSTKRGGAGGSIVNISSMAAFAGGRPGATHYAASKGAVDLFTLALAKEVADEGIRVNAVRPGVTETDMVGGLRTDAVARSAVEATIPMGRLGTAEEVAAAALWLLSDEASFVSGARIDVSGGGFVVGAATVR